MCGAYSIHHSLEYLQLDPQVVSQVPTYAQIICMQVSCHCAFMRSPAETSSSCDFGCIFGKLCSVAPFDSAPRRAGALGRLAANERQRLTIRWRAAGDRRASGWTNGRRGFGRAAGWTGGGGRFFMGVGCFWFLCFYRTKTHTHFHMMMY